ncbi:MAG: hypothetical protein M3134_10300, partial [Actinomycetota bacterium]|nr:hypothetical protein [Actinomycetota bacterium]
RHDVRYAELQAATGRPPRGGTAATTAGNWAQNYYADGVAGGPVPYEIDSTGLGMWTLWDHFEQTGDRFYLTQRGDVYEAIQRSAQFLTDICRDPTSSLQCASPDSKNTSPAVSLVGAQAVWLGLGAAVDAAHELGTATSEANAAKWTARRTEIGAAIRDRFYDETCNCYTEDPGVGGTLLWPVGFLRYGSDAADSQAEVNFRYVSRAMRGRLDEGGDETKALLGNAFAWAGSPGNLERVRRGLEWVARVPSSDGTHVLGERWVKRKGRVITISGQPHVPTHAMFYIAALQAFGKERYTFR